MKTNQAADPFYYQKRLKEFIRERHPRLVQAHKFIDMRSIQAAQTYRTAIEAGESPLTASARADIVLYEGLIFSRFDTLRCILDTEFPQVPTGRQRQLALLLESYCDDVFARYNLDDGIVARSEYNHLIVDLIESLRTYFQNNDIHLHRRGRPSGKRN